MNKTLTGNKFIDFANEIADRYKGIPGAFDAPSLNYLAEEKKEEPETPKPVSVTYLNEITNIKEENVLYNNNISFLTNILQKQFYKNYFPTVLENIERIVKETVFENTEKLEKTVLKDTENTVIEKVRETVEKETENPGYPTDSINRKEQVRHEKLISEISSVVINKISSGDRDTLEYLKSVPEIAGKEEILYRNIINAIPEKMKEESGVAETRTVPMIVDEPESGRRVFKMTEVPIPAANNGKAIAQAGEANRNAAVQGSEIKSSDAAVSRDGTVSMQEMNVSDIKFQNLNLHNDFNINNTNVFNHSNTNVSNNAYAVNFGWSQSKDSIVPQPGGQDLVYLETEEKNQDENAESERNEESSDLTDKTVPALSVHDKALVVKIVSDSVNDIIRNEVGNIVVNKKENELLRSVSILDTAIYEAAEKHFSKQFEEIFTSNIFEDNSVKTLVKNVVTNKVYRSLTEHVTEEKLSETIQEAGLNEVRNIIRDSNKNINEIITANVITDADNRINNIPSAGISAKPGTDFVNEKTENAEPVNEAFADAKAVPKADVRSTDFGNPNSQVNGYSPVLLEYNTEDDEEKRQAVERVVGKLTANPGRVLSAGDSQTDRIDISNILAAAKTGRYSGIDFGVNLSPKDNFSVTLPELVLREENDEKSTSQSGAEPHISAGGEAENDKTADRAAGKALKIAADRAADKAISSAADKASEKALGIAADRAAEKVLDKSDEMAKLASEKVTLETGRIAAETVKNSFNAGNVIRNAEMIILQHMPEDQAGKLYGSPMVMAARSVAGTELQQVILEYASGEVNEDAAGEQIENIIGRVEKAYTNAGTSMGIDLSYDAAGNGLVSNNRAQMNVRDSGGRAYYRPSVQNSSNRIVNNPFPEQTVLSESSLVYAADPVQAQEELSRKTANLDRQIKEVQKNVTVVNEERNVSEKDITEITEKVVKNAVKKELTSPESVSETEKLIRREAKTQVQSQMDENITHITDQVYQKLEQRLRTERGRRGLI